MKGKIISSIRLLIAFLVTATVILSGCGKSDIGAGTVGTATPGEASGTSEVPSATIQQVQHIETTTISVPTFPPPGYPPPVIPATSIPTQSPGQYPPPMIEAQPAVSPTLVPTLPSPETEANNPYPLQGTPVAQQQELPNPYPSPPEVVQAVPTGEIIQATPAAAAVTGAPPVLSAPVPTSLATIIKTQLVATDPSQITLEAGRPQLILFFADWCPLCKSFAPVILGIEGQYKDRVNFIYFDVDDPGTDNFKSDLNYRLIARPRLYLLDPQGAVLRDWTGYVPREELQAAIDTIGAVSP